MDRDALFVLIKKQIMQIVPDVCDSDIDIQGKMADLGANSIDRTEIIIAVMEELNINLPLVSFGGAKNINELIEILYKASSNQHHSGHL